MNAPQNDGHLTHDWTVVHDVRGEFTQIHSDQCDSNGTPEYVLSVLVAPGDERQAAEKIAAALRGEA